MCSDNNKLMQSPAEGSSPPTESDPISILASAAVDSPLNLPLNNSIHLSSI
jgi:hypothetical protein